MTSKLTALSVAIFLTIGTATPERADAQSLTCSLTIMGTWTLPANHVGSIGLKSTMLQTEARIRVERGDWTPLDDHSYARVVRFSPDGRWEDRYKRCLDCRDQVVRGVGSWRMREEVRPGCEYRRQFEFYLFIRDSRSTKIVDEKRILFPGVNYMTPRGTRVIDLGDLGRFF